MEALHGTWEQGKFKYNTDADEGVKGQADASPAKVPAVAVRITHDDNINVHARSPTPVASPR